MAGVDVASGDGVAAGTGGEPESFGIETGAVVASCADEDELGTSAVVGACSDVDGGAL